MLLNKLIICFIVTLKVYGLEASVPYEFGLFVTAYMEQKDSPEQKIFDDPKPQNEKEAIYEFLDRYVSPPKGKDEFMQQFEKIEKTEDAVNKLEEYIKNNPKKIENIRANLFMKDLQKDYNQKIQKALNFENVFNNAKIQQYMKNIYDARIKDMGFKILAEDCISFKDGNELIKCKRYFEVKDNKIRRKTGERENDDIYKNRGDLKKGLQVTNKELQKYITIDESHMGILKTIREHTDITLAPNCPT